MEGFEEDEGVGDVEFWVMADCEVVVSYLEGTGFGDVTCLW